MLYELHMLLRVFFFRSFNDVIRQNCSFLLKAHTAVLEIGYLNYLSMINRKLATRSDFNQYQVKDPFESLKFKLLLRQIIAHILEFFNK